MSSMSSCSVTPFSMARGKWKFICSVLPVATSAAQVIRLQSRFVSCGRYQTSPNRTFSVISTSFGAKSASGFLGIQASPRVSDPTWLPSLRGSGRPGFSACVVGCTGGSLIARPVFGLLLDLEGEQLRIDDLGIRATAHAQIECIDGRHFVGG